jgi:integrase
MTTKPKWLPVANHAGVFIWHEVKKTPDGPKPCGAYDGKRCRCTPKYRGEVWNPETRRPMKSARYDTLGEAGGWVADKRRGLDTATPANVAGVVVEELFATFITAARAGHALAKGGGTYSPATVGDRGVYVRDFRHHVAPHVKGKTTGQMTPEAWQIVVEKMTESGTKDRYGEPTGKPLSTGTMVGILAAVGAMYRWACAPSRRIVATNPLRDVEIPKVGKPKRKRVCAPEVIPALLDALGRRPLQRGPLPNPSFRVAWAIMFYAGLRVSEAVALDWSDVELTRDGGWITVGKSKSEAGTERRIPIAKPLARILWDWRGDTLRIGPICTGTRTLRVTDSGVADAGAKAWEHAGFPIFSPHEARHTFASAVIANRDVSLADLKEWLGHTSLATTDAYVKTLPGYRSESAGARISGAFG